MDCLAPAGGAKLGTVRVTGGHIKVVIFRGLSPQHISSLSKC